MAQPHVGGRRHRVWRDGGQDTVRCVGGERDLVWRRRVAESRVRQLRLEGTETQRAWMGAHSGGHRWRRDGRTWRRARQWQASGWCRGGWSHGRAAGLRIGRDICIWAILAVTCWAMHQRATWTRHKRAMHQRATRTGPCLAQWAWGEAQAQFGASFQKTSCRVMLVPGKKKAGFVPARVTRPTWPARPVNSPRRMREDATRDHHRPKEMLNFLLHYPYSLITNGFGSRH
jgi:hypothetical protein